MKTEDRSPGGLTFWTLLAVGWAVVGFGFWTLLRDADLTDPLYVLVYALGTNVVHDALIAPLAATVGYGLVRFLPFYLRGPVAWGLFTTAVVVAMGFVPLTSSGREIENTSVLPLNYWTSVPTVIGVVWAVVGLMILVPALRRRRSAQAALAAAEQS